VGQASLLPNCADSTTAHKTACSLGRPENGDRSTVEVHFAYTDDEYSRRVLKRDYRTIGGVEKTVEYNGFIYGGWNHVMTVRINENHTPRGRVASYVWGRAWRNCHPPLFDDVAFCNS
jgi:hypothetical protein